MYLLDTDHMSILRRGGAPALRLTLRMGEVSDTAICSCVVVYEEQMRGWLAEAARVKTGSERIVVYAALTNNLKIYCGLPLLPFDEAASEQFDTLQAAKVRVGTQDLKIASIALANNATVLTRNTRDFGKVPGLLFADWTI